MKKRLLFSAVLTVVFTVSSWAQASGPNPKNQMATTACDLNLPLLFPSYNSQCAVEFTDLTIPEIVDSCGNTVTPTTDLSIFPITATGTTTIVWEFINELGGIETANQNINILDFILPVPDVAILPNFFSQCAVQATDLPIPTATDNCSAVTVTNNAVFPITVSTLITWTYTDATGNFSYQDQDIYINDFTEPVADVAILPNVHALCQVDETDLVPPTATDNCGGLVTVTNNATFPILRSTLITWYYTDENGNVSYQDQDIYIDDFDAPVPDTASLPDFHALCQVSEADLIAPTATDNCSVASVTNDGIFPILASTIITWTFADPSGNTVTQTQRIIIDDVTNPVPDAAVLPDVVSQCALSATDLVIPTATDNCSIASVTNDGIFPITASRTITWTFADPSGNSVSQLQNIIINDTTAPTPDTVVLSDVLAQCELLETDLVPPTATDNCSGIVTVTNDGVFPITASTTINWTYSDGNGNSTSQIQNIIIDDTLGPTPDLAVLTDLTAECALLETDLVVPSATDNCSGVAGITNDGVFPIIASTTITWTYTDGDGNSSTQTQNIVINDTTPPTPDTIALADIVADCEVRESDLVVPTATDNCSGIVTVSHDGVFPVTTATTITWTYADAGGNTSSQTQNIIISDTTAPVPDAAVLADVNGQCGVQEIDLTAPTATDNCSVVTVTNDGIFPITASTTITWTFADANGNTATQTQNIVIDDTTAPTPDNTILDDVVALCQVVEANLTTPTATDNCSSVMVAHNATFPIYTTTTITWTFTDSNGNASTQEQNIVINDTTAPTPDAITLADITAECQVFESDITAPTATDNCSVVVVTHNTIFPIATSTIITWTFTDANGNATTQTQDVLIGDNTPPTATLTDTTVSVDVTGNVTVVAAQLENGTATDNCGIAGISVFPNTFNCTELGDHVVTVTILDIHGNVTQQTVTVTVTDPSDFCSALGVDQNESVTLTLFPNPTSDQVYLQGNNLNIRSVSVYSISGQLIQSESYQQSAEQYSISLKTLPQGMYLLKFQTSEGTFTRRVMKY